MAGGRIMKRNLTICYLLVFVRFGHSASIYNEYNPKHCRRLCTLTSFRSMYINDLKNLLPNNKCNHYTTLEAPSTINYQSWQSNRFQN